MLKLNEYGSRLGEVHGQVVISFRSLPGRGTPPRCNDDVSCLLPRYLHLE
jgi:hypothetical protein